jgi:hypothetical protein
MDDTLTEAEEIDICINFVLGELADKPDYFLINLHDIYRTIGAAFQVPEEHLKSATFESPEFVTAGWFREAARQALAGLARRED